MPYVNIKITKEGATADQKAQLIKGVTQLLVDVLGKNPQTTVVVIEEVDTDNWGIGMIGCTQKEREIVWKCKRISTEIAANGLTDAFKGVIVYSRNWLCYIGLCNHRNKMEAVFYTD